MITILLATEIYSSADAQSPSINNKTSNNQNSSLGLVSSPKKSFGLRISTPVTGEQVLINGSNYFTKNGQNLTVQGFSVYNANNSLTCYVSVIVNNVKPYQIANGTGPKGNNDFTTWKYTFSTHYAPLKVGSNKITSKLSCQPGNLVSYYSVNVTGSKFNGTFANSTQVHLSPHIIPSVSNSSSTISNNTNFSSTTIGQSNQSFSTPTPPVILQPSVSNSSSTISNNTNSNPISSSSSSSPNSEINNNSSMTKSMSITIEKMESGKIISLVITAKDSTTDRPIEGAFLSGSINGEPFSGISNSNGEFTKILSLNVLKSSSTLQVTVTATADGYKSNKANTSFDLSSKPKSTATTGNINTNINNGAKDMASKIAKDVQRQLNKQGINIPLPFGG